jgi:hypothetical protein
LNIDKQQIFSDTKGDNPSTLFLLSLLYALGCMYALTEGIKDIFIIDNWYLWSAHAVLIFFVILLFIYTDLLKKVLYGFFNNLGGELLFWFLFYFMLVVIIHPDRAVFESRFYGDIIRGVIPGLLLGILSFGEITSKRLSGPLQPKIKAKNRFRKAYVFVISSICLAVLIQTSIIIFSLERDVQYLILYLRGRPEIGYQSFSIYAIVANILSINYVYVFLQKKDSTTRRTYIVCASLVLVITVVYSLLCSMVGSKKEVFASILLFIFYIYSTKPRHLIFDKAQINISGAIFIVAACSAFVLLFSSWAGMNYALPSIKIFDFGGGINTTSFSGRIQLLFSYGFDQLSYNPIFGDIGVEYKYGGAGLYIHSLISVQSHLGIIGSFTLFGYLTHRLFHLYRASNYGVLKIVVPVIVFTTIVSSFFTWLPFWFVIGALLTPGFLNRV